MLRRALRLCRLQFRGRGATWLALVGQLVGVVGLPLPAASAKDLSTPFPCQHRACGCMSAADCFKSCCCFSAGERVAWAQANDVEPPVTLVEEAEQESECAHCPHMSPPCEHGPQSSRSEKSCCSKKKAPTAASGDKTESTGSRWLLVIQARRCHGNDAGVASGCTALPPAEPVAWQFDWQPAGVVNLPALIATVFPCGPTPPPPRAC